MALVLNCECGVAVRGEDESELVTAARAHLDALHPQVSAVVSDDQLVEMSEEEPA
jgi:hypothetical protein